MHLDDVDPETAASRLALVSNVPPEHRGRLVRLAAVRPVECIAVAWMASIVDVGRAEERRARAARWIGYGDAPLDVVAGDLGFTR